MKLTFALAILAAGLPFAGGDSQDDGKKLRELHKERIAGLQQFVAVATEQHKQGQGGLQTVFESRLMLLNAERDASEANKERIAIQERIVELLKDKEKVMDALHKNSVGTIVDVFKAKDERLKAEIDLEELKSHSGKATTE